MASSCESALSQYDHISPNCLLDLLASDIFGSIPPKTKFQANANLASRLQTSMTKSQIQPSIIASRFEKVVSVQGHLCPIFSAFYDHTGDRIFTGGDDNLVKVWDAKTGWLIHSIRAHQSMTRNQKGAIVDLALDPDNGYFASCSTDKTIRIWDLFTYCPLDLIVVTKVITSISFSPCLTASNRVLVVSCADSKVRVYKSTEREGVYDKTPIELISGTLARDQVSCVAYDRLGTKFATAGDDGIIYLFGLPVDSTQGSIKMIQYFESHVAPVNDLIFSSSGTMIVSGCKQGVMVLYSIDLVTRVWTTKRVSIHLFSKQEIKTVIDPVVVERETTILTTALMEQNINDILRSTSSDLLAPITVVDNVVNTTKTSKYVEIQALIWTRDDNLVISATSDFHLRVWYPLTGEHKLTLFGHQSTIVCLEAHPYYSMLIMSGSIDGTLIMWDISKGSILRQFSLPSGLVSGLFSPDGMQCIVTDIKGYVHIYTVGGGESLKTPSQQFLDLDWIPVKEDHQGVLIDIQSERQGHMVEQGLITTSHRTPYPSTKEMEAVRSCIYARENYYMHELRVKRELDYCMDQRYRGGEGEAPKMDKKLLLKRRRQVVIESDDRVVERAVVDLIDYNLMPIPLPISSGEEYSEESDTPVMNEMSGFVEHIESEDSSGSASSGSSGSSISYRRNRRNSEDSSVSLRGRRVKRERESSLSASLTDNSQEDEESDYKSKRASIIRNQMDDSDESDEPIRPSRISPRVKRIKQEQRIPPMWLMGTTESKLPQIGDSFLYSEVQCKVVKIAYSVDPKVHCKLTLHSPNDHFEVTLDDNSQPFLLLEPNCISPTERDRILLLLVDILTIYELLPFINPVDYALFPDYLTIVAYPIHIKLIHDRLLNNFYRSLNQIIHEWDLMCSNASLYNPKGSPIVNVANSILAPLALRLQGIIPSPKQPSIYLEKSNSDDSDYFDSIQQKKMKAKLVKRRKRKSMVDEIDNDSEGEYKGSDGASASEEDDDSEGSSY